MNRVRPDEQTIRAALSLAVRAPSVHNTQPWRFQIGDGAVHIYLDAARTLRATDPDQRDALVSCGAAIHHLRIAFASLGWSAVVHRLPDRSDPEHLAMLELVRHRPTDTEIALAEAISTRQTDRRHFSSWPIPPGYLGLVSERAAAQGGIVRRAANAARDCLVAAMYEAGRRHAGNSEYRLELANWSGRQDTNDGVPSWTAPPPRAGQGIPTREFAGPLLVDPTNEPDYAELLVLGTAYDDRPSRLAAGEAVSAVLLTAANVGLATCLLTEPLEIPELRRRIRAGVLDNRAHPQAVIRIGWLPAGATRLPSAPRRPIDELLDPFDSDRAAC
ncbi:MULTISPECIES: NAD(P)H nitroreductase [unclassified Nocardia]|uniref:Acg family FMN-binding oxidoreductase n=1 Tax=unclassified Nocardia TaxID=2637762 RepID=UPI001CE42253|nr:MULTISPECIES: NAD(P)H nitroreductase [unclassified Nocardia]